MRAGLPIFYEQRATGAYLLQKTKHWERLEHFFCWRSNFFIIFLFPSQNKAEDRFFDGGRSESTFSKGFFCLHEKIGKSFLRLCVTGHNYSNRFSARYHAVTSPILSCICDHNCTTVVFTFESAMRMMECDFHQNLHQTNCCFIQKNNSESTNQARNWTKYQLAMWHHNNMLGTVLWQPT